ncbi:MAG: hypothetical protein ACXADY_02715 [Candidatus Hodarchaeales archaeon]|jgi:hypothetical protein
METEQSIGVCVSPLSRNRELEYVKEIGRLKADVVKEHTHHIHYQQRYSEEKTKNQEYKLLIAGNSKIYKSMLIILQILLSALLSVYVNDILGLSDQILPIILSVTLFYVSFHYISHKIGKPLK